MRTGEYWTRARCEEASLLIAQHGLSYVIEAWKTTRAALDCAFRRHGLGTAHSYQRARPGVRKVAGTATPPTPPPARGAPVEDLDFDDDGETRPTDPVLPPPPPPPSRTSVHDTDPVRAREEKDEATRLRRQVGELVERVRAAEARQGFLDAIASNREAPRILPRETSLGVREMAAVALASDWHVEEPIDPESVAGRNAYDLEIAARRIERFFRAIIWNIEHHRASGRIAIRDLVLWLGGDLYSGYIHPELVENNALSPTQTIRWLLPRLRDGIATLLNHLELEHLEIPCSFGNHGRTTDKRRISTGFANSFDWLLYHSLADDFRQEPRIHFEITRSAHQYVEVYGRTIHFHHGDSVRYKGGVGGLGIPLLKAVPPWDDVRRADVHCIGHWHQLRDYGRAVVNGSLCGFGPYSFDIHAPFEEPKQAMFFIDRERGKSMPSELWVADATPSVAA